MRSGPKLNVELIQQTLDYITLHPEEWDQGDFVRSGSCQTTMCFAGTAVHLLGHRFKMTEFGFIASLEDGRSISDVAAESLGLTDREEMTLFFDVQTDDVATMWATVQALLDVSLDVPDDLVDRVAAATLPAIKEYEIGVPIDD